MRPDAETPTDLNVCLLVGWHLSEAEWRDVAPHAKSLGDASTRVAGIYQVRREGEQPAQKQQHYVVNTNLCVHRICQNAMATLQKDQNSQKHNSITETCYSV